MKPVLRRRRPRGVGGKELPTPHKYHWYSGAAAQCSRNHPARPCAATQRKPSTRCILISKSLPTDSGISSSFDPLIVQMLLCLKDVKSRALFPGFWQSFPATGVQTRRKFQCFKRVVIFFLISPSINRALKPKYWLTSDILLMKPLFHAIYSYRHYSALN